MSSEDFVIKVDGLGKHYQIFDTPQARLKQFLGGRVRQLVGLKPRKYYRDFRALDGVSFVVRKGETVGIIGRNGSGKSTLLQLICGTLFPTSGEVRTNGRIAALLELGSGFNPEFTGRENVYLNASILGVSAKEIDERFHLIEQFADIGEFIDQPIKIYSSGMVVRLAFATAIHTDPDILVVDEALAVGDTAFQQKCLNRIRQMQEEGVSILLVTHSANTLIEYCDRGIYLKHGVMVMDGACRDVVKAYNDDLLEEEGAILMGALVDQESAEPDAQVVEVHGEGAASSDAMNMPNRDNSGAAEHAMLIEMAQISDLHGRPVSTVQYGDRLYVDVVVVVARQIDDPCFGVQITSTDGIALWSTTTMSMAIDVGALSPGRHRFRWELKADFSGNRYITAVGAGHVVDGEYKRLHRLDYAGHFDVLPVPRTGAGWLAPHPRFEVRLANGAEA